jgi:hypothetical protein
MLHSPMLWPYSHIILDWEGLPGTNALGYLIKSVKSFVTLALDYL